MALEDLAEAVRSYDVGRSRSCARELVEGDGDPVEALSTITQVMKEIGDRYGAGELWLPDLVGAADAATAGLEVIEEAIAKSGRQAARLGTVVIGTVYGDIHSIGKTMVGALLTANRFKVLDVGTDVPSAQFVKAVADNQPDILAMSAILTTTAPEQSKVIQAIEEAGLRDKVKIIVGGAAITPQFADEIGADGYRDTAPEAVELATRLVRK